MRGYVPRIRDRARSRLTRARKPATISMTKSRTVARFPQGLVAPKEKRKARERIPTISQQLLRTHTVARDNNAHVRIFLARKEQYRATNILPSVFRRNRTGSSRWRPWKTILILSQKRKTPRAMKWNSERTALYPRNVAREERKYFRGEKERENSCQSAWKSPYHLLSNERQWGWQRCRQYITCVYLELAPLLLITAQCVSEVQRPDFCAILHGLGRQAGCCETDKEISGYKGITGHRQAVKSSRSSFWLRVKPKWTTTLAHVIVSNYLSLWIIIYILSMYSLVLSLSVYFPDCTCI